MKKLKVILAWLFVIALLVTSLNFVQQRQSQVPCRYVKIEILDSLENGFVSKDEIFNVLTKSYGKVLGMPLHSINTKVLEEAVLKNKAIKTCDIYKTVEGSLHIEILQRKPVLRIINKKGQSYYISEEGYLIPFTLRHPLQLLVANGQIAENFNLDMEKRYHINHFNKKGETNILSDLRQFANYVYADEFWSAQFVQLYVNKKQEIELIPRVGAHIIILGKPDNFENKLLKLKALYMKGLSNVGWNNYETINLKYKNQVICSKR